MKSFLFHKKKKKKNIMHLFWFCTVRFCIPLFSMEKIYSSGSAGLKRFWKKGDEVSSKPEEISSIDDVMEKRNGNGLNVIINPCPSQKLNPYNLQAIRSL